MVAFDSAVKLKNKMRKMYIFNLLSNLLLFFLFWSMRLADSHRRFEPFSYLEVVMETYQWKQNNATFHYIIGALFTM